MLQDDAHEFLLHIELVRSFVNAALHSDTQGPHVRQEDVVLLI